jgi:repressor LexA
MTSSLYVSRKRQLVEFYRENKCLPTYDELAELFGVKSKGSLHKYIQRFIEDGLVGKSDGGKLIPTTKLYGLRVLGTVQAGFPTDADEADEEDTMSLDEHLIDHPSATYLLAVSGDSMKDAGIIEGDMVIVDRNKKPNIGDIVIAHIDNEWTMKYLMEKRRQLFLRAANEQYPDIHPEDELQIAGVVTGVIRKYH